MATKNYNLENFFPASVVVGGGVGSGVVKDGIPTAEEYPADAGEFNDIIFHLAEFIRAKADKQEIIEALGATYDPSDKNQLKNELAKALGKGIIGQAGVPNAGDFIDPVVAIVDTNTGVIYTKDAGGNINKQGSLVKPKAGVAVATDFDDGTAIVEDTNTGKLYTRAQDGTISVIGSSKDATETESGVVKLATESDIETGTDEKKAVTPKAVHDYVATISPIQIFRCYRDAGKVTAELSVEVFDKMPFIDDNNGVDKTGLNPTDPCAKMVTNSDIEILKSGFYNISYRTGGDFCLSAGDSINFQWVLVITKPDKSILKVQAVIINNDVGCGDNKPTGVSMVYLPKGTKLETKYHLGYSGNPSARHYFTPSDNYIEIAFLGDKSW